MHCLLRFDDIIDLDLFTRQNINDLPDRVKAAILADWAEQRPMLVRKVKLTEEERLALIDYFNDAYWNTAVPPEFYAQEFSAWSKHSRATRSPFSWPTSATSRTSPSTSRRSPGARAIRLIRAACRPKARRRWWPGPFAHSCLRCQNVGCPAMDF